MKLVIGLGNPGKEYERTRHNAGFLALDSLAKNWDAEFKLNKKLKSEIAECKIGAEKIILARPQTFMNESGVAARALTDFYKIKPKDITVVHDDKDIPLGEYRDQTDRSSAGHNGIKSIIEHLSTQNFRRIRIGIATPALAQYSASADFVLGKFSKEEMKILDAVLKEIVQKLNNWDR